MFYRFPPPPPPSSSLPFVVKVPHATRCWHSRSPSLPTTTLVFMTRTAVPKVSLSGAPDTYLGCDSPAAIRISRGLVAAFVSTSSLTAPGLQPRNCRCEPCAGVGREQQPGGELPGERSRFY